MLGVLAKYFKDVSVLRRLLFAAVFLTPELPMFWEVVVEFATGGKVSKSSVTPEQVRAMVENLQALNSAAFDTDVFLQTELMSMTIPGKKPLGYILISPVAICASCGSQLQLRKDRHASVTIYDHRLGTIPGAHFHKLCQKKTCNVAQYYGYYTNKGQVVFNSNWESLRYFGSSRETFFAVEFLQQSDAHLLLGQLSFKQQAEIYNYTHGYSGGTTATNDLEFRQQMDRRRLEEAFLQYAILKTSKWYPSLGPEVIFLHDGLSGTLSSVTPQFLNTFIQTYSEHRCDTPGCGQVLVMDGNMKNNREVCYAVDAGFTEFVNLPGKVKTGCPNTPAYKSRYCEVHAPFITTPCNVDATEDDAQVAVNSCNTEPRLAGIITSKRTTRSSVFYKVAWLGKPVVESTWEPAAALPPDLVAEFESGITTEVQRQSVTAGGQTLHTLATVPKDSIESPPASKRAKLAPSDLVSNTSGSFTLPEDHSLTCKTEKDAHGRLNYRTAGILAGIHPCGIITMVVELFGAESKGQVYGHLHSYLSTNEPATQSLGTICYDDACHLCKYARHRDRRSLTPTAERLASMAFVVDRMHFRGHVDPWCQENCNPDKFAIMDKVNSEICEQTFSWLSRYSKMTRHMNRERFMFFILYLCELHNRHSQK